MIFLMVRAHRPHCALHPRQPYTSPHDRTALVLTAERISASEITLQEQTIIAGPAGFKIVDTTYRAGGLDAKQIYFLFILKY
jgi:hypothetical protein